MRSDYESTLVCSRLDVTFLFFGHRMQSGMIHKKSFFCSLDGVVGWQVGCPP